MKIKWKPFGKYNKKQEGTLSVPIDKDLTIDKQWSGHGAYAQAWIEDGRLCILVKRPIRREAK